MKIYDFNGKKNICGERVKAARKRLALTQEQPAAKLQLAGIILERNSISRGSRLARASSRISSLRRCAGSLVLRPRIFGGRRSEKRPEKHRFFFHARFAKTKQIWRISVEILPKNLLFTNFLDDFKTENGADRNAVCAVFVYFTL